MSKFILTNADFDITPLVYCYGCKRKLFLEDARTEHFYNSPERQATFTLCSACEPIFGSDIAGIFNRWRFEEAGKP